MDRITHCPCCGVRINVATTIMDLIEKAKQVGFTPKGAVLHPSQLNKLVEEMGPVYSPSNNVGKYIEFSGVRLHMDESVTKIRIEVEI